MVTRLIILLFITSMIGHANDLTDSIYWFSTPKSSSVGFAVSGKTNFNDSLFYNPAGLNTVSTGSINLAYTSLYEFDSTTISFILPNPIIDFGVGLIRNQSSDIEKTIFNESINTIENIGTYHYSYSSIFIGGATSMPYFSSIHIGVAYHLHQLSIDKDIMNGAGANLGVLFTPYNLLSIGYTMYNFIPLKLFWANKFQMKPNFLNSRHNVNSMSKIGIELTVLNFKTFQWKLLFDSVQSSTTSTQDIYIGTDFTYKSHRLTAGYNSRYLSIGISTKLNILEFNYSLLLPKDNDILDSRHDIGATFYFE